MVKPYRPSPTKPGPWSMFHKRVIPFPVSRVRTIDYGTPRPTLTIWLPILTRGGFFRNPPHTGRIRFDDKRNEIQYRLRMDGNVYLLELSGERLDPCEFSILAKWVGTGFSRQFVCLTCNQEASQVKLLNKSRTWVCSWCQPECVRSSSLCRYTARDRCQA